MTRQAMITMHFPLRTQQLIRLSFSGTATILHCHENTIVDLISYAIFTICQHRCFVTTSFSKVAPTQAINKPHSRTGEQGTYLKNGEASAFNIFMNTEILF